MNENPKTAHKNAQKSSENFKPCIHNVVQGTGVNFAKIWLSKCLQMPLLGSQGIVVKCTAAIFSVRWIDTPDSTIPCQEPITRSVQQPYIPVTAFSQTDLFLD